MFELPNAFFHAEDDWTREETDYLFELCKTYDLRFLIIADRYDYDGKSRSIEVMHHCHFRACSCQIQDLKERYYSVTRKILLARNPMADPNQKADIAMLHYDKGALIHRSYGISALCSQGFGKKNVY